MKQLTRFCLTLALSLACHLGSTGSTCAQLYQGPYGTDGRWNVYELVNDRVSWSEALDEAESRSQNGVAGQLVDILSPQENALVEWISGGVPVWVGLTDREGAAPVVISGGVASPQESSGLPDPRTQGWAWTSGAPFTYNNWNLDEPIDHRGAEDAVHLLPSGRWNDISSGYGVDEPIEPQLQPGTSASESSRFRVPYLVEYPLDSPTPLAGIATPTVPAKMPLFPPGPLGDEGRLSVTDFRGDFVVPDRVQEVSQLLTQIRTGQVAAQTWSADYPRADVTDPDSNRQGGPIIDSLPFPFPSDTPGTNDGNFISIARGTVRVPETGVYTIQVRSAAGFALQIGDNVFESVSGDGQLDRTDNRTIYHSVFTGDSDTRGVIELTAGDYELQFMSWATLRQAYWEITTAKGAHTNDVSAQWLALGDGRTIPPRTDVPVAKLVGAATVSNVRQFDTDPTTRFDSAREQIATAMTDGTALTRDDVTTIVLRDSDGICCKRPGFTLDPQDTFLWPLNDPDRGGQVEGEEFYSSGIFGQIVVDDGDDVDGETLPITFGMFASDGAQLHVRGVDFTDTNAGSEQLAVVDGDWALTFPYTAGNSDTLGVLELTEGIVYDFDAIHFQERGDSGFELWAALGENLDGFDSSLFFPVSSVLDAPTLPRNIGLTFVAAPGLVEGDFNGDRRLDIDDLNLLVDATRAADMSFDVNLDGTVDINDVQSWIRDIKVTWIGDVNLDGRFDSSDLVGVLSAGAYELEIPATWAQGDWDLDGYFRTSDLVFALQDGGYESGLRGQAMAVPETFPPNAWLGLLALLMSLRQTRQSGK